MNWTLQGHPVKGMYEILYADPPWAYKDRNIPSGAQAQYLTMGLADLAALPVGELASQDSVLFLWSTWPTLDDGLALIRAWGFDYVNCAFLWVKTNKIKPSAFVGLGHWTRGNSEPCLLARRGSPHRVDAAVRQIIEGEGLVCAPLGRHSAKPPEVRDRIIRLMGDRPAIELFARERAPGWDAFGNEIDPAASVQLTP